MLRAYIYDMTQATGENKMTIKEYCEKYNRPIDNNFAAACYRDNSVSDLEAALGESADATDCKTWGMCPGEWRDAIESALTELRCQTK